MLAFVSGCGGASIGGVLDVPRDAPDAAEMIEDPTREADASIREREDAGIKPPEAHDAGTPIMMPPPADGWPTAWAEREDEMLVLVNELRAAGVRCGRTNFRATTALSMNAELREAARLHSKDMADRDYFDHTSLDGRSPWDRIDDAGYDGFGIGENIAAGNAAARDTFEQWVSSPGHCSNMMNPDAREIGIGYANNARASFEHYWTQTFGQ